MLAVALALATEAILTVRPPAELTLKPGERASAVIEMSVREGFHVQANPAANEFLIPLSLALEEAQAVKLGEPRYPPPQRHRLEGTEEDLLVYGGEFAVSVPIQASPSSSPGRYTLEGKVRYQACDERSCRPPAVAAVEVRIRVSKAE